MESEDFLWEVGKSVITKDYDSMQFSDKVSKYNNEGTTNDIRQNFNDKIQETD